MGTNGKIELFGLWLALAFFCVRGHAADVNELTSRLFQRLTGAPLFLNDPRRGVMEDLVAKGKLREAAHIATDDESFYNVTLRAWAMPMSNRDEDRFGPFVDFIPMIIGTVRDGRDFREILTADFYYIGDPAKLPDIPMEPPSYFLNYKYMDDLKINLKDALTRVSPQRAGFSDAAGVLTSQAWAVSHLTAGTNRRIVQYTFQEFLCHPLRDIADTSLPDNFVRRDVDRSPGGSSKTYQGTCRGCHAGLDGLTGAFAHVNYAGDSNDLIFQSDVFYKHLQNHNIYPEGHIVVDDSWTNLWASKSELGFRGPQTGRGIRSFGQMMADSRAFSVCMVTKVFRQTCHRSPSETERKMVSSLADDFEDNGYNLRRLFEDVAILPACVGR